VNARPEQAGRFEVRADSNAGLHTLSLSGELDIATADKLSDAVSGAGAASGEKLVIDLSAVGFMDSTGLRVLISANKLALENEFELVIVTGDSPAKRVLELTRMDEHMTVVATLP
jgi:anti-anti-sigma factor